MDPFDQAPPGVQSIKGRISLADMGSLAVRQRPVKRGGQVRGLPPAPRQFSGQLLYSPVTRQNQQAYQLWLSKCRRAMEDTPEDIMRSVADQLLAICKSQAPESQKEEEARLLGVESSVFVELATLAALITDYKLARGGPRLQAEEQAIVLHSESSSHSSEEDEGEQQLDEEGGIRLRGHDDLGIPASQLTREWLHGKLAQEGVNPELSQQLETALGLDKQISAERELLKLLGRQRVGLVRTLLGSRIKLYYSLAYNGAKTLQQKNSVAHAIMDNKGGQALLRQLRGELALESREEGAALEGQVMKLNKRVLDLTNLINSQRQKDQDQSNIKLPQNCQRKQHIGYEQIVVHPKHVTLSAEGKKAIEQLPPWAKGAFAQMKELNPIQSRVCEVALNSTDNMLVCAPTGAGKTNIAVLAMLQTIGMHLASDSTVRLQQFKVVYLAPMKALVAEITNHLTSRLKYLGISVRELTGDSSLSRQLIDETQVIIATPEKWDIVTRKSGDKAFTQKVRLLIIDEVHLLNDDRGPVLESLIARTIRAVQSSKDFTRLVGLSATLPNYKDVAALLRVPPQGLFFFDISYRPIPLTQRYLGIAEQKGARRLLLLNQLLHETVQARAGSSQMIVFVHARKQTWKTAQSIKQFLQTRNMLQKLLRNDSDSKKILDEIANKEGGVVSPHLKKLLPFGIGIHHAGMERSDRQLAEGLFASRHLQILVSTATLAWGVNLPAQTVIVRGTQVYRPEEGKWVSLSGQEVMQMLGRAGRPAYDVQGQGVIISSTKEIGQYIGLLNAQLPLQSRLLNSLADCLNAQLVLGTVNSLAQAVRWLSYTFLFIRMLKNPRYYSIAEEELREDPSLVRRRSNLAHTAMTILERAGLVLYDRRTGRLSSTGLGKICSHYYVKHESMLVYTQNLQSTSRLIDLLRVFSLSSEFKHLQVREEERVELAALAETVPVPIKGSPLDPSTKVNVLLQAYISRLPLAGHALNCDMVYVTQNAARLSRALFQVCLRKGWGTSTLQALELAKMVEKGIWGCASPLRQFKQVPTSIAARFEKKENLAWQNVLLLGPQDIGELVKEPRIGKVLHRMVHQVPKLQLQAYAQPITRSCVRIQVTLRPQFDWDQECHGHEELFWLFALDGDQDSLLYYQQVAFRQGQAQQVLLFTLPLFEVPHPLYYIRVLSDRWVSPDSFLPISFKSMVLPAKFPTPTSLLNQPNIAASELSFSRVLSQLSIQQLNPIQSQCIQAFLGSSANLLLAAPPGSGRIVPALLAIEQHLAERQGKVVFITGCQQSCAQRHSQLQSLFGTVNKLVGQPTLDAQTLSTSRVIVSGPQSWDVLTRRWRARKGFDQIRLVVVQDLQLIGNQGSSLEVAVSRLRYVASMIDNPPRIIGIACSVANYLDLADWLGVQKEMSFGYGLKTKSPGLKVQVEGFQQQSRNSRIQAIHRKAFQLIVEEARRRCVLFTSDRRQAVASAVELASYLSCDSAPVHETLSAEATKGITDKVLLHVLRFGVGFVYPQMQNQLIQTVLGLWEQGSISVLTGPSAVSWRLGKKADLVCLVDGFRWEEGQWLDYSLAETMQMMSCAQSKGHFYFCCHFSKCQFYSKFLGESLPLQSQLNFWLEEHLNGEIVAKTVQGKQDCIDWLTWTFLYRRLLLNPNYYNLSQTSASAINQFLSELVQAAVEGLEKAACVVVEDETGLTPLNMGIIAAYYNLRIATVATFISKLPQTVTFKAMITLLSEAKELSLISIRPEEEDLLERLLREQGIKHENVPLSLLQAHLNRLPVPPALQPALRTVLLCCPRLVHALVDILSSLNQLKPLLLSIHLSQTIVQGMRPNDSKLLQLQLPQQEVDRLTALGVCDVYSFVNAEDETRGELSARTIQAVNRYSFMQLQVKQVSNSDGTVRVSVALEREGELTSEWVYAPRYPGRKEEWWWVVVGEKSSGRVLGTKKLVVKDRGQVEVAFEPQGLQSCTVYGLCDSYLGCDQQQQLDLRQVEH